MCLGTQSWPKSAVTFFATSQLRFGIKWDGRFDKDFDLQSVDWGNRSF
jgi:hypothetical protein